MALPRDENTGPGGKKTLEMEVMIYKSLASSEHLAQVLHRSMTWPLLHATLSHLEADALL